MTDHDVVDETNDDATADDDEAPIALDGRTLGRRGQATRRKLMDATEKLLAEQGLRELRVVDIAREVGSSPATFYQYFKDVDDAVLSLADDLVMEIPPIVEIMNDGDWYGPDGLDICRKLVKSFLNFWDRHRAVLRTRNLASEEGDQRFREVRLRALTPITNALFAQLRQSVKDGRISSSINPYAAAAALVAMLERMGSYHLELEGREQVPKGDVVETPARIVYQTVTGKTGD